MSSTLAENNVLQLYENNDVNQSIWVMGFSNWIDFFTKNGAEIAENGISTTVTAEGQVRMNVTSIPVSEIKAEGNGNFLKGLEKATKDFSCCIGNRAFINSEGFQKC